MAAKICADIKPTGLRQRDLVDLLYDIVYSLRGICQKLDDDTGASVVLTTYEANCFTALFNCCIEDSAGNTIRNVLSESTTVPATAFISPRGIGDRELLDVLYMIMDSLETLTEQIDSDNFASSAYEATYYTAVVLYLVKNSKSQTMGNDDEYTFHTGAWSHKELVDLLYQLVYSISLITAAIDADGNADTDYTSLWYTATITLTVENSKGSRIGN